MIKMSSVALVIGILFLSIALVIICVFIVENRTHRLEENEVSIPEFSIDVNYDPYPRRVNFENQHDCNALTLRVCLVDDVQTLIGCRELTVICRNFDRDLQYVENGHTVWIPKNKHPKEGYALAITAEVRACNPFHGDWALVSNGVESDEYTLICVCKNDGYIGNDNVLGSCETVRVCNGKIKEINVPFDAIECDCEQTEVCDRYDDAWSTPYCRQMLVIEANEHFSDWTDHIKFANDRLLDVRKFNPTVRDNLNVKLLLDPCRSSIINPKQSISDAFYDTYHKSCVFVENGLPLRVGFFPSEPQSEPDSDVYFTSIPLDAALPTSSIEYVRIIDKVLGKRSIVNLRATLNVDLKDGKPSRTGSTANFMLSEKVSVGLYAQLRFKIKEEMLNGTCVAHLTTFKCWMQDRYAGTIGGIPTAFMECPPAIFLWDTEQWEFAEQLTSAGIIPNPLGVTLDTKVLNRFGKHAKYYGIRLCSAKNMDPNCHNGALFLSDPNDWDQHFRLLDD